MKIKGCHTFKEQRGAHNDHYTWVGQQTPFAYDLVKLDTYKSPREPIPKFDNPIYNQRPLRADKLEKSEEVGPGYYKADEQYNKNS